MSNRQSSEEVIIWEDFGFSSDRRLKPEGQITFVAVRKVAARSPKGRNRGADHGRRYECLA